MASTDGSERTSHIAVEAVAACPFSMAEAYAADYLHAAELRGPEAEVGVRWLPGLGIGRRVMLAFGIHSDALDHGRQHDEMRITWRTGSRLLPDFHGSIRFRIDANRTRVLVDGTYLPPLGLVGRLFDRAVGGTIARASMQGLADRIAAYLTQREVSWRAEQANAAT
jgi:hypothetical protein